LRVTPEPADRPEDFDLAETWASIVDTVDERRVWYHARALADPEATGWLRGIFGRRISVGELRDDGRHELELRSWSARSLAGELAGLGSRVEVTSPDEARIELARIGNELRRLYPPTTEALAP
jgi:predicted DNA-binding transcriptional regulator YafY